MFADAFNSCDIVVQGTGLKYCSDTAQSAAGRQQQKQRGSMVSDRNVHVQNQFFRRIEV